MDRQNEQESVKVQIEDKRSVCYLVRKNRPGMEILLGMSKQGFSKGKFNGIGGRFDFSLGDRNLADTAMRETQEEIEVNVQGLKQVAILYTCYPTKDENNQELHIFLCDRWNGIPMETIEMKPEWFNISKLPFNQMWPDDIYWLPLVLLGYALEGRFIFTKDHKLLGAKILLT